MSSAATKVAHDEPRPSLMPTNMNGADEGTTTLRKIDPSLAPSTVAALMRVLSTFTTPWKVAITQAKNAAKEITTIFGSSPMPNKTIASGIIASGGTVLKNCT